MRARRTIQVSELLAKELRQWAEDEQASWPADTAFQEDLGDLLRQLQNEPTAHDWMPSALGHGEAMCRICKVTNREAAALGILDKCEPAA